MFHMRRKTALFYDLNMGLDLGPYRSLHGVRRLHKDKRALSCFTKQLIYATHCSRRCGLGAGDANEGRLVIVALALALARRALLVALALALALGRRCSLRRNLGLGFCSSGRCRGSFSKALSIQTGALQCLIAALF